MTENSNYSLTGKTILITGASKNMGRCIALASATAGANVVAHYFSDSSLTHIDSLQKLVSQQDKSILSFQADLTNEQQVQNLFNFAESQLSKVDIVINTSGYIVNSALSDTSLDAYQRIFENNVKSAFLIYKEAAKRINRNGRIINFSSSLTASQRGPGYAVYAAAKAATEQLAKFLADELAPKAVTVNTISPGPIDNSFLQSCESKQGMDFLATLSVFNRLGLNDDITPLVLFLISNQASWITGQNIKINGGMVS